MSGRRRRWQGIDRRGQLGLAVLVAAGLLFVLLAVLVIRPATMAPDGWVTVDGRIVSEVVDRSGDSVVAYPVVEYMDAEGVVHEVRSRTGSSFRSTIGDSITVAYDPARPSDARVTGGMASIGWLLFAGFGGLFASFGGLLLVGSLTLPSGRTVAGAVLGGAVVREPGGREAFRRSRARVWIDLYGELALAVVLLYVGLFAGLPGTFTIVAVPIAAILLLGAWSAYHRRHAEVAEVREDGLDIPGLGFRTWDELAEIRIERYPGTGDSAKGYRRLGLVPRDPLLADARPPSERLMWAVVRPMLHTYTAAGVQVDEPAPFGISEQEIGQEAFERLVAAVTRHHEVIQHGPPLRMPEIVEAALPSLAPAAGPSRRSSPLTAGLRETLGVVQVFLVLGLMGRFAAAALGGPQARESLAVVAVMVIVAAVIAFRPVRSWLGRGATPRARAVLIATGAAGALAGMFLPELLMALAAA